MMEIDEKLPMKKLEQLETNRIRSAIDENFPFHFLIEIQKCYQEISKDLKNNKNKNLEYKIKIAAIYLSILKNEENIIYNLFLYNKDMNKFLIRELCIFLTILFLNDFDEIKNTDILDLMKKFLKRKIIIVKIKKTKMKKKKKKIIIQNIIIRNVSH